MNLQQTTDRARALKDSKGYALAVYIAATESGYSTDQISAELRKGRKHKKYQYKPNPNARHWTPYAD